MRWMGRLGWRGDVKGCLPLSWGVCHLGEGVLGRAACLQLEKTLGGDQLGLTGRLPALQSTGSLYPGGGAFFATVTDRLPALVSPGPSHMVYSALSR